MAVYIDSKMGKCRSFSVEATEPWCFDRFLLVIDKPESMVKASDLNFKNGSLWFHFFEQDNGKYTCLFEGVECDEHNCCWGLGDKPQNSSYF